MNVHSEKSNDVAGVQPNGMASRLSLGRMGMAIFLVVLLGADAALAAGGPKSDSELMKEAIYQGINLILILGVILYFGRGPIVEFFSTRKKTIQSELSEAADLLSKAEQRNADLQRRLVDLSSEVEGIRESANQRADEEAERILADARASAERIRRDAQAAVDQELRRAQASLQEEAADLALEIARQKLTAEVSESDRDRLVDEFITRVQPAGSAEGAN